MKLNKNTKCLKSINSKHEWKRIPRTLTILCRKCSMPYQELT